MSKKLYRIKPQHSCIQDSEKKPTQALTSCSRSSDSSAGLYEFFIYMRYCLTFVGNVHRFSQESAVSARRDSLELFRMFSMNE